MKTIALLTRRMYNGGIERVVSLLIPILNQAENRVILLTNDPPTENDYPVPIHTTRYVLPKGGETRQKILEYVFEREKIDILFVHAYYQLTCADDFKTAKK